jgi:integrase
MAVVPRKTKGGIVYYVDTRGHRERVGGDKREAQRLDARRKKELKDGTFQPLVTGAVTVGKYLRQWLAGRKNRSAETERSLLETHALSCSWLCAMRMDDVRPLHAKRFFLELQAKVSLRTGKQLKPKYIANVHGALKAAFNAAILDEVIPRDVWRLPPGLLSKKSAPRVPYSREDAAKLLAANDGIRRVWLALALYTGMRCGEIAGRRWRDLLSAEPLNCMLISSQYLDEPLKTDRPRKAPVHLTLGEILAHWRVRGFSELFLRAPSVDDFIVPSQHDVTRPLDRFAARKAMEACCTKAGVVHRGVHATRHTFISEVQRGGADQRVVERITHNASGGMIDHYTHRHWDELCAAMMCLRPYQDSSGSAGAATGNAAAPDGASAVTLPPSEVWTPAQPDEILDAALDAKSPHLVFKVPEGSDSRTRTPGSARYFLEFAEYGLTYEQARARLLSQVLESGAVLAAGKDRLSSGERARLGVTS